MQLQYTAAMTKIMRRSCGGSRYYILLLVVIAHTTSVASSTTTSSVVPSIPNPFAKKKVSKFAQLQSFALGGKSSKRKRNNGGGSGNNSNANGQNNNNNAKKKRKNNNAMLRIQAQNLLAGLASAIALIPEASTFAMTAGLSPLVGLGSTIIMATCSGALGGRPGLVSGASATVSMILKPLGQEENGPLMVALAVILAGWIQIGLGMTRCGKYIRVVPRPVMVGFVNGLSIKCIRAQIPHFQHPHGVWLRGSALKWHSILVAGSALIIEYFPKILAKRNSIVPSPLIALGLASILVEQMDLPVPKLVDIVGPEAFQGGIGTLMQALFPFAGSDEMGVNPRWLPPYGSMFTLERILKAFPTALEVAVIGLLQSLLTLQIVDEKTNTKGKNTKESIAQGLGNLVSGSMGGMGGSALLGQSLVNVQAGGTGRLSSIAVSVFVLAGVTCFAPLLGQIPVATLVGLMFSVAQHTFSWTTLGSAVKGQIPLPDVFIICSVTMTTVFVNTAAGVGLGVLVSALRFAWQASCNISARSNGKGTALHNRNIYVQGPLFFGSAMTFQKLSAPSQRDLETAARLQPRFQLLAKRKKQEKNYNNASPPPPLFSTGRETVIDFLHSQVWDHAAIMAIESVCKRYHDLGVKLHLRHLSPDCREKILECSDVGEWSTEFDVDPSADPSYLVGVDPTSKSK